MSISGFPSIEKTINYAFVDPWAPTRIGRIAQAILGFALKGYDVS
ncbi:hypothetical protein [Candidatus Neptunochlamydia vexilliferae]|nr:hypothetical protein [Candidatus Neptunochlamydia vexilliferae]